MSGFAVGSQDDGEQDRIRESVRDAVESAESVRERVHRADVGASKGETCAIGRLLHLEARLFVMSVLVSGIQILKDEVHRRESVLLRALGIRATDIRLHRVGQGVETRRGSHGLREIIGKGGIEHGVVRDQVQVIHQILVTIFGIGDDRGHRDLAARTCRRGHRKEGRDILADLQETLHLREGTIGAGDLRAATLGAVHRGAAADGDQAVTALLGVDLIGVGDIMHGGIGHRFAVD